MECLILQKLSVTVNARDVVLSACDVNDHLAQAALSTAVSENAAAPSSSLCVCKCIYKYNGGGVIVLPCVIAYQHYSRIIERYIKLFNKLTVQLIKKFLSANHLTSLRVFFWFLVFDIQQE